MSEQVKISWTADTILSFLRSHRETLRSMGVKRIGLFGSYARNEQRESSDVDLLFSMDTFTWMSKKARLRPMTKTLNDYLALPYTIEVMPDDGAWFAQVKELPGCMTEVDEWDQILPAIEEAKRLWIELALERGRPIPEPAGVAR